MMRKQKNRENGITLIALVVTIIVLIILAGVSISMLVGDNGIITQAQKAKLDTEIANEKEAVSIAYTGVMIENEGGGVSAEELKQEMIQNGRTDVKNVTDNANQIIVEFNSGRKYTINANGKIEEDNNNIEIKNTKSIWFGDSAMRGHGNNDKGFPEYFSEITGAECLNISYSGTTITDNTGEALSTDGPITLKRQVEAVLDRSDLVQPEEIDFIVLDGGGNDIVGYINGSIDSKFMKEVGTASDTTSDTVVNDFREVITMLKENFPDAKIIYLQPGAGDRIALELIAFKVYFGDATVEEINQTSGLNFKTIQEVREYVFEHDFNGLNTALVPINSRMEQLWTEIKSICNEYNIQYLDFNDIIVENRSTDGSDTNSYLQKDMMHLTDEAYTVMPSIIIETIKTMF